ncbi:MAG: hypothetical protein IT433_12820 [Phycisphaerales bacterium]|nr:hypothetical protein [Phycisphaerales bacterium]
MPLNTARRRVATFIAAALAFGMVATPESHAQPDDYTDLGVVTEPTTFELFVELRSGSDVRWYSVEIGACTAEAGFLDLWTSRAFLENSLPDARVCMYRGDGTVIVAGRWVTEWSEWHMSFGQLDPRPPVTYPEAEGVEPWPAPPSMGQEGSLPAGRYWFAVGNDQICLPDQWRVVPTRPPESPRRFMHLYLRIQPPDIPYCDGDFNWDGNTDQDDVMYLANVLAGGENPTGRFADYNRDGNEDQDDLLALVHTIAGGGCP